MWAVHTTARRTAVKPAAWQSAKYRSGCGSVQLASTGASSTPRVIVRASRWLACSAGVMFPPAADRGRSAVRSLVLGCLAGRARAGGCLLYTSDAADDLLCVDLGGR